MKDQKDYINLIKETKGQALKERPDKEKTSLMCRLAIEYDKNLIEHVPNKYLPEVVTGEDFINEVARRSEKIIRNEAHFLNQMLNGQYDEERHVQTKLKDFNQKLEKEMARVYHLNPDEVKIPILSDKENHKHK